MHFDIAAYKAKNIADREVKHLAAVNKAIAAKRAHADQRQEDAMIAALQKVSAAAMATWLRSKKGRDFSQLNRRMLVNTIVAEA